MNAVESGARLDIFETGDQTALVCHDVPEVQRLLVEQLGDLGYKIHTGLSVEDMLLKMRTHVYEVIIISAHFNGSALHTNPLYLGATGVHPAQRRVQVVILTGSQFITGDEMQSFVNSVDLVIGLADVVNLRPILRRTVLRHQEFYLPFHDAEGSAAA